MGFHILYDYFRSGPNLLASYGEFEDTKGVIRIHKSTKNRQHNGQMKKGQQDKQRSTNHYTQNQRSSNTNPTKNRGRTQVLRKG